MNRRKKKLLAGAIVLALILAAAATLMSAGLASPALWLILGAAALVPLLLRREACQDFIAWRDDFGVGFPLIDSDHKKLLSLVNNVLAAQQCETGTVLERQALDELVDYTEYHFQREEALMTRYGYGDYAAHKAQHDQMRNQVARYLQRYEEKGREILPLVANHLKLWLLQHIAGTDRRLAPFLAQHAQPDAQPETRADA
jgi:hemerythrin